MDSHVWPLGKFVFQHTAARRRLKAHDPPVGHRAVVSTHSRAKAAEGIFWSFLQKFTVSTHSRAKAADKFTGIKTLDYVVSTHSRAKAAELVCGAGQF